MENITDEIKRIKGQFLRRLESNTKTSKVFSYKEYAKWLNTDIYSLKMTVKELIKDGYPIISTKLEERIGLVICTNDDDYNHYVNNIQFKMNRMQEKMDLIKKNYIKE